MLGFRVCLRYFRHGRGWVVVRERWREQSAASAGLAERGEVREREDGKVARFNEISIGEPAKRPRKAIERGIRTRRRLESGHWSVHKQFIADAALSPLIRPARVRSPRLLPALALVRHVLQDAVRQSGMSLANHLHLLNVCHLTRDAGCPCSFSSSTNLAYDLLHHPIYTSLLPPMQISIHPQTPATHSSPLRSARSTRAAMS